MSHSRRYNKLKSRIKALELHFLPQPKLSGNYTVKETDFTKAYVILVHAEIETYFEEVAKHKAQVTLAKWRSDRRKSNCLLSVMSFMTPEIQWENDDHKNCLEYRINKSVSHYISILDRNNGIKANNIFSMLLPLGIEERELDPTWLIDMDSFGGARGNFAHSSHSVQLQIDPTTEKDRINNQILPIIANVDTLIRKLW